MMPAIALIGAIAQLAPTVTRLFKGSETSVEMAETAAAIARKVTGTTTNDDALVALQTNPTALVEYQKALLDHEKAMEELVTLDKQSARERDVEFLKSGTRNYRADILVGVTVLIIATILVVVVLAEDLDEYAKGVLTTILGVFLNQLTNVFSFEFGTTRKDEAKNTEAFKQMVGTNGTAGKGD